MAMKKKKVAICQYDANFWDCLILMKVGFNVIQWLYMFLGKVNTKKKSSLILIRTEIEMIQ